MEIGVRTLMDLLVLSSMYILLALGFAFMFSILGLLHIAHGAIYMIGGYLCYVFSVQFGLNQWLALLLALVIMSAFGLLMEKFGFRPFLGDFNRTIVMGIAIITVLTTTAGLFMSASAMSLPPFISGFLTVGIFNISSEKLLTFVVGGICLLALTLFVRKTRTGQQMLAVSQEREGALLQGININRISAIACVVGCALAALAGSFLGAILYIDAFVGDYMLVKAIQIVLLSGIGNIGGILIGGLIIAGLDAVLPLFTSGAITQTIILVSVIVILLIKPQGLFGRRSI